nr:isoprenylcysteine carboxylmethyltransferase family protein [uncultured Cohaesibacter sp.]
MTKTDDDSVRTDAVKLQSPGIRLAIPPLIFVLCGGSALALEWFFFRSVGPLSALGIPVMALVILGFLVGWAGFAFMGWGFFKFKAVGTTTTLKDSASELVSNGAFRYSRNPMYVGFVALLLGGAIMFDSVPFIVATVIMFVYLDHYIIVREERYLSEEFGESYRAYCQSVRRWL